MIKKFFKKIDIVIIIVLLIGFIFRLVVINLAFHIDILSLAGWGRWIYQNGPFGFYENSTWVDSWPTQPPLVNLLYGWCYSLYLWLNTAFVSISTIIASKHLAPSHLLWWFNFVQWFGNAHYRQTGYNTGYLITIKLIGSLADIAIAYLIYLIAKKYNPKLKIIVPLIYLFSPFSLYISALWGQYDQVSFLFLLISLLELQRKNFVVSSLSLSLSLNLKPTSLIFIPFYLWIYSFAKPSIKSVIFSTVISFGVFLASLAPFTHQNLVSYTFNELYNKIFNKSEYRIASDAFNFWKIIIGDKLLNQNEPILLIPTKYWGYLMFLLLNIICFWIGKSSSLFNWFKGVFVVGFGSWLFLTNMQERYAFSGIATLVILMIWERALIWWGLILTCLFFINLLYSWPFIPQLGFLKDLFKGNDAILSRLIAFLELVVFLQIVRLLKLDLKVKVNSLGVLILRKFLNLTN